MKIASMFTSEKTVFSLEVFPPKKDSPPETIYNVLAEMSSINPDFISVTYGAGGNLADNSTCEIAATIKNQYKIEPLVHLTCLNSSASDVLTMLSRFKDNNIENIMALRGDVNPAVTPKDDFKHASDLISFIKKAGDFNISGACYPEGHIDTPDQVQDIFNLKTKVDAGAEHLVTQLFFDNSLFYDFLEKTRLAGISIPIGAGIMPVTNKKQIEKMVSLCGVSLPKKFVKVMQRYEYNPTALRDAGIAYAIDQIVDLLAHNVDEIHLYTMNNPYVALTIHKSIASLLKK